MKGKIIIRRKISSSCYKNSLPAAVKEEEEDFYIFHQIMSKNSLFCDVIGRLKHLLQRET
jgi:hypothetical protein